MPCSPESHRYISLGVLGLLVVCGVVFGAAGCCGPCSWFSWAGATRRRMSFGLPLDRRRRVLGVINYRGVRADFFAGAFVLGEGWPGKSRDAKRVRNEALLDPGTQAGATEGRLTMKLMRVLLMGVLLYGRGLRPGGGGFCRPGRPPGSGGGLTHPGHGAERIWGRRLRIIFQYFDATLKDVITKEKFLQVRSQILKSTGAYQSRRYLGYLQKGKTTVILWKGRFAASADDCPDQAGGFPRGKRNQGVGFVVSIKSSRPAIVKLTES